MTRSTESLERRAKKRNRTLEEQQAAETEAANKKTKLNNIKSTREKDRHEVSVPAPVIPKEDPLTEPGAWKCPSCGNHNFASRYICNSKTCNEARPESAIIRQGGQQQASSFQASHHHHRRLPEGGQRGPVSGTSRKTTIKTTADRSLNKKPPRRHDPETSKVIDWTKPQASQSLIEQNQQLRQRLRDGDPTLQGDELERAKLLVARDERKLQKKQAQRASKHKAKAAEEKNPSTSVDKTGSTLQDKKDAAAETDGHDETDKSAALRHPKKLLAMREQQKANRQLLKKLQETKGEGLTESETFKALEIQARKINKLLMKTYETTGGGKGMSEEDAGRAKRLIEKKARKQEQKRQVLNGKTKRKASSS